MHLIHNCSSYLGSFLSTSPTDTSAKEFQKAISLGNVDVITQLGKESLLSVPLPNGELPLNYAVRQSQQASVRTLLQLGANPTTCDDQQLSAISTAYYKGDPQLIEELLHFVTQDMEIGREIRGEGAPSIKNCLAVANAVKHIQTRHQRVLDYLSKGSNIYIHNDKTLQAMINSLVREEPINDITGTFTNIRESYLHVAILTGNIKILEKLLKNIDSVQLKKYLNCTNETPLHYAAALGRLDMMKMLVEAGAKLRPDNKTSSPFAFLAAKLNQQSPFAISIYDAEIFICSMALWMIQLPSFVSQFDIRLFQFFQLVSYSPLIFNFDKSAILYPLLSFIGMNASYLSPSLTSLSLAVKAVLTIKLAYQTFQGLRACWRNSSLGYGKALLKSVVVHAPKAVLSFNQLRGLGETLGILNPMTSTQLQEIDELSKRDLKCLQRSLKTGQFAKHCFTRSLDIYSTCHVDSNSNECTTALKSYDDYFRRADYSTYPMCQPDSGGGIDALNRFRYCENKLSNWKDKCYTLFDSQLDPVACEEAEKAFEAAKTNGFAPDYNDDYWRKLFMHEYRKFDCSTQTGRSEDCQKKYQAWKNECGMSDHLGTPQYKYTMNLQGCKKAEDTFRKGIKENGFKKDPPKPKASNSKQGSSQNNQKESTGNNDNNKHWWGWNDWWNSNSKQNSNNNGHFKNTQKNPDYTQTNLLRNQITCKEAVKTLTGDQDSTYGQVKKMYRKKALSEHPDKNPKNPNASQDFVKLGALYDYITKCKEENWIK